MIDSLDMDDSHRAQLLDTVNQTKEQRILITHGTDTMVQTAQYIQDHIEDKNKVITFVGSMIPMEGFYFSDAGFNLGFAFSCVQQSDAGVYLCMNGKKFTPKNVKKNIEQSRFEYKKAI